MIQGQRCETCAYCVTDPNTMAKGTGECRYDTPRVFLFPGKNALSGQNQMIPYSAYPPVVLEDVGCEKYTQKNGPKTEDVIETSDVERA